MLLGATAQPQQTSLPALLASTVPLVLLWTMPVLLGATAQPQQASLPVLLASTVPLGPLWTTPVWLGATAQPQAANLPALLALGLLLWRPLCVPTVVQACIPLHWGLLQLLRARTVQLALTLRALGLQLHLAVSIVELDRTPPPQAPQLLLLARAAERVLPTPPKTPSAWLAPLSTVQRVPAMVATMVMATAAAPAWRIRGVWVKSPLFVLNFLPPQL